MESTRESPVPRYCSLLLYLHLLSTLFKPKPEHQEARMTITAGLVDSHCHLDIISTEPDEIREMLRKCLDSGMSHLVQISTSLESFLTVVPFIREFPELLSITLGLMPGADIELVNHKFIKIIEEKQICAIGEIGLDYFRSPDTREEQIALFERQCALALDNGLPVVIHNREADADLLAVLSSFPGLEGVLHCFTGDREMAGRLLDLGFHISFSGIATFRNAEQIRQAALLVPQERILVETDAPYLAPVPVRGGENRPWYAAHTAAFLADLRGEGIEDFIACTGQNARRLFGF